MYPRDYFLIIPEDHFLNSDTALEVKWSVYVCIYDKLRNLHFYDSGITIIAVSCTETKYPYNYNTKELIE